jgi:hypothetical protein
MRDAAQGNVSHKRSWYAHLLYVTSTAVFFLMLGTVLSSLTQESSRAGAAAMVEFTKLSQVNRTARPLSRRVLGGKLYCPIEQGLSNVPGQTQLTTRAGMLLDGKGEVYKSRMEQSTAKKALMRVNA